MGPKKPWEGEKIRKVTILEGKSAGKREVEDGLNPSIKTERATKKKEK